MGGGGENITMSRNLSFLIVSTMSRYAYSTVIMPYSGLRRKMATSFNKPFVHLSGLWIDHVPGWYWPEALLSSYV